MTTETTTTTTETHDDHDAKATSCPNCEWTGTLGDLAPLDNVYERVDPGDTMPYGECPDCGACCYPTEPEGWTVEALWKKAERERDTLRAVLADVWSRWDSHDTEDAPELAKRIEAALEGTPAPAVPKQEPWAIVTLHGGLVQGIDISPGMSNAIYVLDCDTDEDKVNLSGPGCARSSETVEEAAARIAASYDKELKDDEA